jgi:hypothetical protein
MVRHHPKTDISLLFVLATLTGGGGGMGGMDM